MFLPVLWKHRKTLLSVIVGASLVSGLALTHRAQAADSAPSKAGNDSQTNAPVIVHLVSRNYRITIKSNAGEPIYVVQDKNGKTLADHLNEAQLQAQHPKIYEEFKSAIAIPAQRDGHSSNTRPSHPIIDASVDDRHLRLTSDTPQPFN